MLEERGLWLHTEALKSSRGAFDAQMKREVANATSFCGLTHSGAASVDLIRSLKNPPLGRM